MSKKLFALAIYAGLTSTANVSAEPVAVWSLESSIQQALNVAPELKTADAEIGKQQGKLEQAGAWPNPSVNIQVDDKLGIEDASGGYEVTQLAISQALPLSRLRHQRTQARSALAGAEAKRRQQQLMLEYKIAQRFHTLQLTDAKLQLAQKRLRQANRYQQNSPKHSIKDPLVRYLTPLERMRLDIVLQAAKQNVSVAEGEYNEAAASFKTLLAMPIKSELKLAPLTAIAIPEAFTVMEKALQNHPMLEADKQALASAQAGVAVAKSQRFNDPVLTLFREKDYLANRRQDVTGVMLSIQVPLWNQGKGLVSQARYLVHQAQAELNLQQRELRTRLHKSYLHLGHLIEQAEHYRNKLLKPAQQVFELTRKGFKAGELNILTLIDANNTYFSAQERYFELLQEGSLELAAVRQSAGISLLDNSAVPSSKFNNGTAFGEVN